MWYGLLLWMEFQCLNATEPLWGDSLFFIMSPQGFVVLILSTLVEWKAGPVIEPPSGFEPETSGTEIECPDHKAIATLNANKSL